MSIREKIDAANARVLEILQNARPQWVDVQPARDAIPGFAPNLILVAGPPIAPQDIVPPVRVAATGAAVYEGLAATQEEAWQKILAGEILLKPAQDYNCACGAAMALTASMPVLVCEDKKYGGKGFCGPHPGNFSNVLRWGYYNEEVQKDLVWFRDHYGPALGEAVRKAGGIDIVNVLSRTAGMGDENHNRQPAASMFLALQLIPAMLDCGFAHRDEIIKQFAANDRFFLHVMMAGAECAVAAAREVPYSTVMTAMGGNGVDFGIQIAGTGHRWYTTPAPKIRGLLLKPSYTEEDMVGFLGDSCVTEIYGLGGMSAIAGPGYVVLTGATFADARQRTEDARAVSLGEHTFAPIPWDEGRGFPVGIDARRVVGLNIVPTSHGGGTLKAGGQASMGCAKLPLECFQQALEGLTDSIRNEVNA